MSEDSHSFGVARVRLEEIVVQVRKKDTSLEKSLDLLEEGVRLANQCTELIDHADWEAAMPGSGSDGESMPDGGDQDAEHSSGDMIASDVSEGDMVESDAGEIAESDADEAEDGDQGESASDDRADR